MVENIEKVADNVDWSNYNSILDFYEKHQVYFNNYEIVTNPDTIVDIIEIKARYIDALISKRRYTKGLEIAVHVDFLLEKIENKTESHVELNVENLFQKGVLHGYLKNYKESFGIFSELIKIDSDNDLYKDWHIQMRINQFYKNIKMAGYLGLVIVFGDILLDLGFNYRLNEKIVLVGFILLIATWIIPLVMKYVLKRKETTVHNNK